MTRTRALITGISGQDGSYLTDLLLDKGYEVHGILRRPPDAESDRSRGTGNVVTLHHGDSLDRDFLVHVLELAQPREIYNLAARSSAAASWNEPTVVGDVTGMAVARLLEAVRSLDATPRLFQASSSEIYGKPSVSPQTEDTAVCPTNPYGAAKAYSHFMTAAYRTHHELFCCNGILFNHESPRRRREFVSRKVTRAAAKIKLGLGSELRLGSLDARRDWGYAGDYVEAMWLMLQQEEPGDYVVSTGVTHAVSDLVEIAFDHVGLNPWRYVRLDEQFVRPAEAAPLVGDSTKAREILGWQPRMPFEDLVRSMVSADLEQLRKREAVT